MRYRGGDYWLRVEGIAQWIGLYLLWAAVMVVLCLLAVKLW